MSQYAKHQSYTNVSDKNIYLDTFTGNIKLSAEGINEMMLIKTIAELIKQYPIIELQAKLSELEKL